MIHKYTLLTPIHTFIIVLSGCWRIKRWYYKVLTKLCLYMTLHDQGWAFVWWHDLRGKLNFLFWMAEEVSNSGDVFNYWPLKPTTFGLIPTTALGFAELSGWLLSGRSRSDLELAEKCSWWFQQTQVELPRYQKGWTAEMKHKKSLNLLILITIHF